jgi:hypothetical protein
MKDKQILEQVKLYNQQTSDQVSLAKFRQMQQFIDVGIQNSLSKDGAETIGVLVTTLLSLRDFLTNDIFENSFKISLLKNIQNLENEELANQGVETSDAVAKTVQHVEEVEKEVYKKKE